MAAAATTLTTLTELVNSEAIESLIMDYALDAMNASSFCRISDISSDATLVASFPIWVKDVAVAVSEGSDMDLDDLETTQVSVTAGMFGVLREVTDLVASTTILGSALVPEIIAEASRLCMEKLEDLVVACFTNASGSVGTTTANLTIAQFVGAYHALNANLVQGQKVAVLAPIQVADLVDALIAATATVWSNPGTDNRLLNGQSGVDGNMGALLNVPVYQSSLCDLSGDSEDRIGAMFVNGNAGNGGNPKFAAYGLAMKWLPKVRVTSDAPGSSDVLGITMCAGAAEIRDASTIKIVSDA
jgi:hypothetical protein